MRDRHTRFGMHVRDVRWFLAVVDAGTVSAAADRVFVSQPGLSRAIDRLEEELGARLFARDGRRLRLSAAGTAFIGPAQQLVEREDAARAAVARLADPDHGEVRLAFLHTLGTWLVPDLLRRYRTLRPEVRFRLQQNGAEPVVAAVRAREVDLGFVSPRPGGRDLAWERLDVERLCLAVPSDHPLARRRRATLADLRSGPLITFVRGHGLRGITDELCARAGVEPRYAFESEEPGTVRGLVAAGLGIAVVPPPHRAGAEEMPGVRHLPLAGPGAVREIGLAWIAGRERPAVVEAFRGFVVDQGRDGVYARSGEA